MNPWHDVSYGENVPDEVNMIVEIPRFSNLKYEVDKKTGLLVLDRALYSATYYPGNYGFVPQTYWEDNDPLDIIVLGNQALYPLSLVSVRPIGVIHMQDNGESDDKIIGVVVNDPRFEEVQDISDVSSHILKELRNFFETYKQLQGKEVKVLEIRGAKFAKEAVQKGIELYEKKFR